jgi:hypothetical protein
MPSPDQVRGCNIRHAVQLEPWIADRVRNDKPGIIRNFAISASLGCVYLKETFMTDILIDSIAGVTTITLNRVAKKNSLTTAMYSALADALTQAQDDAAVRVVVFQGHETIFSSGNDIADFLKNPPTSIDAPVFQFMRALNQFAKPIIAAVCGPAVGIGTTMLFHCDLVYAGDNAAFSMPCWATRSWPRQRWRWGWSAASCHRQKSMHWRSARRKSWLPNR